ncbi:MAG: tyrosine-type recombinase/integrase [Solirubrobacteraceae bacterium]
MRHTYGSLLVAGGIDVVSVKAAMGHARISTTERYLHAPPATDQATRFNHALAGGTTATKSTPPAVNDSGAARTKLKRRLDHRSASRPRA